MPKMRGNLAILQVLSGKKWHCHMAGSRYTGLPMADPRMCLRGSRRLRGAAVSEDCA
jgi:hypothetical protein